MIISRRFSTNNGVELVERFSNEGKTLIRNDGIEFDTAIDATESAYTYTESTANDAE